MNIPQIRAAELAKKYDLDQVIIIGKKQDETKIVYYGRDRNQDAMYLCEWLSKQL